MDDTPNDDSFSDFIDKVKQPSGESEPENIIWQYDDESHMKAVRKRLSSLNKLPNSLMPKEIAYEAKVVHSLTS